MAEPLERRWTLDEFFAWSEVQSERYELVNGRPQKLQPATNGHDDIVVNVLTALARRLRGSGRRVFSGSGAVETFPGQIRRPDVGVDGGERNPNAYLAQAPCVVVEVLAPRVRTLDGQKFGEYVSVVGLMHILVIRPDAPFVWLHSRGSDDVWGQCHFERLDDEASLPAAGIALSMREIYEGVAFPSQDQLATELRA